MSKQIQGQTQISNREILKQSLNEMGIKFTEKGETISWGSGYQTCSINFASKVVSHDDMYGKNLNGVQQKYTVNMIKNEIIKRGHRVKSTKVLPNGKVEIIASY